MALPLEKEDMEPSFHHIPKAELPQWQESGLEFTLVAGKAFSRTSPVPVHSDLYMLKVISEDQEGIFSMDGLFGEFGRCPVRGAAHFKGNKIFPGEMLVVEDFDDDTIELDRNSLLMIFGGTPFQEPRYIDWNFVSSDKEKIEKAKERWRNKEFEMIEGKTVMSRCLLCKSSWSLLSLTEA